ncbi:type VII secretion target [Gryllotalpicola koreensis]|uniref:Excreted virulence factor EspC (Type VII ESX diderm) n=1 Tax=Gryllotalpicola koreensis TaxID=993086 RepID=A0ABP7ZUW2_9MICO
MSDQLKVDTHNVRQLAHAMRVIKDQLDHADDYADALRSAVGSDSLGDVIHDFAHNWSIHRGKIQGDVDKVASAADSVADGFEQTDQKLGDAVTAKGKH